ncbi:hypothetical protein CEXT_718661 [Caerostris extrusa]|uniref:Reverse transcriptase domain-containing protein n=1 Tax=Caerostris extrusa TaxID=172846 RepID=A0AAV4US98_CAEEX|nr:hypothetical protein CEXT_718661 [Caerostris extrusa]
MTFLAELKKKKDIECALYAEDLVLWTSGSRRHSDKIMFRINQALEAFYEWSTENLMKKIPAKELLKPISPIHMGSIRKECYDEDIIS